jgi:hypothetical protein
MEWNEPKKREEVFSKSKSMRPNAVSEVEHWLVQ